MTCAFARLIGGPSDMQLIDVNILLYAVNADSEHHLAAHAWLERTLSGDRIIALPWVVLLGFIRISTNDRIFERPLSAEQAIELVDGWRGRSNVVALSPGPHHWDILHALLRGRRGAGAITTDAHLAALAIEHGSELCSTDRDFGRFEGLSWINPL